MINQISMRQLLVLLFAGLLSPAIQALPGQSAAVAGRAGWLSALAALPAALLLCWLLFALLHSVPEGEGLAQALERVLGRAGGKILTALYLLWGVLLLAVSARRYALRFLSTSYRNAPLPLFIIILLAMALWMGRGKLAALVRAGEIFYLALSAVLAVVVFFALFRVQARNILPVWAGDLPMVMHAALPVLSVLGYGVFAAFLAGGVKRDENNRRMTMKWTAALCLALTAMQLACLGSFGPELVGRMDAPFFMMVKGIGVEGAFERVESIVVALWVLSDLALLGMLVFACRRMAEFLFHLKADGGHAAYLIVGVALLGALFLFPDAFFLYNFIEGALSAGNLLFGFCIPVILFLIAKLRKKLS